MVRRTQSWRGPNHDSLDRARDEVGDTSVRVAPPWSGTDSTRALTVAFCAAALSCYPHAAVLFSCVKGVSSSG